MRIVFLGNFQPGVPNPYSSETHHAKSLEALGHEVVRLQEGRATGERILEEAIKSDLLVVIHTHGWTTPGKPLHDVLYRLKGKVPTLTYHLDLWLGLDRQKDLDNDLFYKLVDHFFTVDKLMADWFNQNTSVKGHYLPPAVYDAECTVPPDIMSKANSNDRFKHDVIFVGSKGYHPEWQYRPQLIDWLAATYGDRFAHYGGDGRGVVRGQALNDLYFNSKVAVGDTLCLNFNYPYYFSDRLFETAGRGGFQVFPYIKGLEDCFEIGQEIVTYSFGEFDDLKQIIDYYIEHDDEREAIRRAGHNRVRNEHTYKHRWQTILETIYD